MPHPGRISHDDIITTARRLLEEGGPDAVAMRVLARELGVSAPSLYFHVESREAILRALTESGFADLSRAMHDAFEANGTPEHRAERMAAGYIAFADANPRLFTLMFGPCSDVNEIPQRVAQEASDPVFALADEIAGAGRGVFLAEGLWALVHGYTVLRLAGQFLLNPNHEPGFWASLGALLAGARLAAPAAAS